MTNIYTWFTGLILFGLGVWWGWKRVGKIFDKIETGYKEVKNGERTNEGGDDGRTDEAKRGDEYFETKGTLSGREEVLGSEDVSIRTLTGAAKNNPLLRKDSKQLGDKE